jgi:hypothetical protein
MIETGTPPQDRRKGHRRASKRRCVTIALAEFPDLSSRAIADMCGVNHEMVENARPRVAESATSTRIDTLGRRQPATKRPQIKTPAQEEAFYAKRAKEAPRHLIPAFRGVDKVLTGMPRKESKTRIFKDRGKNRI